MEVYQIKYLDCREKKNRQKLLQEIMKATKQTEKPSKEFLERFSRSVGDKYKMPVKLVKQVDNYLFVSVLVEGDSYSTLECQSYYEALCKYILLVQAYKKYREQKVK